MSFKYVNFPFAVKGVSPTELFLYNFVILTDVA